MSNEQKKTKSIADRVLEVACGEIKRFSKHEKRSAQVVVSMMNKMGERTLTTRTDKETGELMVMRIK